MDQAALRAKYNVPVPRYTSYPPANIFDSAYNDAAFIRDIAESYRYAPSYLSFYVHIPFCRHLCHYCGCNAEKMASEKEVTRYTEALLRHIDLYRTLLSEARPAAQIHYGGGSPTSIPAEHIARINERIRSLFPPTENPESAIECHPGYLTEADWARLPEMGFNRISIGIQDFDPAVLARIGRKPSRLPVEEIVAYLHACKVAVNIDLIYGLPGQTPQSFARAAERVVRSGVERVVTFSYAHLPQLNPRMRILERAPGLPTPEVKQQIFEAAAGVFTAAGYIPVGMDHFVHPGDELAASFAAGELGRNFQGYCTRRTTGQVLAVGSSGISQLTRAYAQNLKTRTAYVEAVEQGHLGIERGYAVTADEAQRRAVIASLMCNYSVPVALYAPLLNDRVAKRLCEQQADGLFTVTEGRLVMQPAARPFVRNVAAVFDIHYDPSASAVPYSKPI